MDEDFLGPPRRMFREYVQHILLIALDVVFMLCWLVLQAIYHSASEWIIGKVGIGVIDKATKILFDVTFAVITFWWVVKTIWRVHKQAFQKRKVRGDSEASKP